MGAQSQRTSAAGLLLSFPLAVIRCVFRRTDRTQVPSDVEHHVPSVTAIPHFEIADRVHLHQFGSLQVSFYLYARKGLIRAVARKERRTKEVDFTPDLADKFDVPFNMDGAIEFIRANGFAQLADARNQRNAPANQRAAKMPSAPSREEVTPAIASAHSTEPAQKQLLSAPQQKLSSGNKNRPFTGRIVSMGESIRPGRNGSAPYATFAVKVKSESGTFEREFLGEHLAELADKHELEIGTLIRLQLLGKNRFDVVVDGQTEERWRNEYALSVLS